jgi:hypothetical protein
MEQRRLRLGDILDDYCPRERRVTNHAVVAMVEETVKQTRCTTCDAEHAYKGGQAPRRRKKDGPSALYKEVLAGKPDTDLPTRIDTPEAVAAVAPDVVASDYGEAVDSDVDGNVMTGTDATVPALVSSPVPARRQPVSELASAVQGSGADDAAPLMAAADAGARELDEVERPADLEDGPVHRQLIRATLPRIDGQKEERRPTDFTIRQSGGRGNTAGNQFRGGGGGGGNDRMRSGSRGGHGGGHGGNTGHRGNGHRPQGGPRFAGARPGQGQGRGQGGGFRSAQQPRHGGGRKRSR